MIDIWIYIYLNIAEAKTDNIRQVLLREEELVLVHQGQKATRQVLGILKEVEVMEDGDAEEVNIRLVSCVCELLCLMNQSLYCSI